MNDVNSYLFSLFGGTLTSLTIWLAILISVDPNKADIITKSAFFASFFLGLTGLLGFLFIYISSSLSSRPVSKIITYSVLQATLLAFASTLVLILQTMRVLGLWELFIILLLVGLSQLYLRATDRGFI